MQARRNLDQNVLATWVTLMDTCRRLLVAETSRPGCMIQGDGS